MLMSDKIYDGLYLLHLLHEFNIYNFFFDFVNYLFLLILFTFCYRYKFLNKRMFIVLLLCSLGPFFINFFLIEWWYMPDQAKYFQETQEFREFLVSGTSYLPNADYIRFPSIIFAFTPIPFIETINSIGFINKGLLGIFTITLFHKKYIDKYFFYFLNLCPSIFLYSSLSLKDNLIMIYCLLIILSIIYHRGYLINIILIVLLFYLRPLHGILLFVYFFTYNICFSRKFLDFNIIFGILMLVALHFNFEEIVDYLHRRRFSFFEEANVFKNTFIELDFTSFSVIKILLKDTFRFLLSPLNLQMNFKIITQSFENFFLYTLLVYLSLKLYKLDRKKAIFWSLSCFFGLMSYGTLIVSDGTIARYRYSFLVIIIFAIYSELRNIKKLNP